MVIAVTGAGGGIGKAIADRLLAGGHAVAYLTHRPAPPRSHPQSFVATLDVTADESVIEQTVKNVVDRLGLIDVWINNAGADILSQPLAGRSYWSRWEALNQVDILGTMRCCRVVVPYLRPGARIVNVAWDRYHRGWPGEEGELYAAAKAAVVGFSRSFARSLRKQGLSVSVQVLAPGWVKTRWGDSLEPARAHRVVAASAIGRWVQPEEVARAVEGLLTMPGDLLNGEVVFLGGDGSQ